MYVPTLSYSHVLFNSKIAKHLIANGHQVTMLLPLVDDNIHFNSSSINVIPSDIGIPSGLLQKQLWQNPGPFENSNPLNPYIFSKLLRVSHIFVKACQAISDDRKLLQQLHSEQYDVGIVEQYDSCGFGIFQTLEISHVLWLSATGIFRSQPSAFNIEYPLSYAPELFAPISNDLTLFDRIMNVCVAGITSLVFVITQSHQSRIFHSDLSFLSSEANSILANTHPIFDFPVPTFDQIVPLAGISVDAEKDVTSLNEYWQTVADSASNGFILVSFGSIAKTIDMDSKMLATFLDSFVRFPNLLFIMKYEAANCTLPLPTNVLTSSWIPQKSLMAHSNYKGIITHGGLSSILESLMYGKPMVLMPLFADHFKNANIVLLRKIGLVVNKAHLTKETLMKSILQIVSDREFTKNCQKISSMLQETRTLVSFEKQLEYRIQNSIKLSRHHFARHLRPRGQTNLLQILESSYVSWITMLFISSTLIYL
ncbi:unnamed protein product [Auanema sp. JU1783]|nr:unnamed protein product [Auanema sp. JU1783]